MMTFIKFIASTGLAFVMQQTVDAILPHDMTRSWVIVWAGVAAILWSAIDDVVWGRVKVKKDTST